MRLRWRYAWAITRKDLTETFSTTQLVFPLVVVPLVIVLGYPTIFLTALRYAPSSASGLADFASGFPPSSIPASLHLSHVGQAAYIGVVYLFAGFFLIVPVMVSTVIAANSFAGEKERRTLEGLLYTPISDLELVVGKIAASFLPAMAFTGLCFVLYGAVVNLLGLPIVGSVFFPTPNWWALVLLLVPSVSAFVISLVVLISIKARGFQEANAIGGSVVLPIIGVVAAQASGIMVMSAGIVTAAAGVFALLDVGLLSLIVGSFGRSRIVGYLK